jgi:hypothetical protein
MSPVRIHIIYDPEHDQDLCDRLLGEVNGGSAGFEVASRSEGSMKTDRSIANARRSILKADEVIVLCGEHTDSSVRTSVEVAIAQESETPYILVWGRRERMCKKPVGARNGDAMYSWTPENLRDQLANALRASRTLEVPDHLKRP